MTSAHALSLSLSTRQRSAWWARIKKGEAACCLLPIEASRVSPVGSDEPKLCLRASQLLAWWEDRPSLVPRLLDKASERAALR